MDYLKQLPSEGYYQLPPPGYYSQLPLQEEKRSISETTEGDSEEAMDDYCLFLIVVVGDGDRTFTDEPIYRGPLDPDQQGKIPDRSDSLLPSIRWISTLSDPVQDPESRESGEACGSVASLSRGNARSFCRHLTAFQKWKSSI